jgi:hypothetical protein
MMKKIKNKQLNNKNNHQEEMVKQEDLVINKLNNKDKMKNKDKYIKKN